MQSCSVDHTEELRIYERAKKRAMVLLCSLCFYKKHIKYMKKLLNIHIFLIDVWNVRWYNKAYRMTKSQFVFLIELAVR